MKFDYKKEFKEFYLPKKDPQIIHIPTMNFIAVRGQGDPNEVDGEYRVSISLLYRIANIIKKSDKSEHKIKGYFDYVVPPLESFWWKERGTDGDYSGAEELQWISMIRMPEFVSEEDVYWAKSEAEKRKKQDYSRVEFLAYTEGSCIQCLHVGTYDQKTAVSRLMAEYAESQEYEIDITKIRPHHEIYLSDVRRCAPEKLKTIIRHPVRKRRCNE